MFRDFRNFLTCLSLGCLLALPGCGGGGSSNNTAETLPTPTTIQFFNAGPDLGIAQFQAGIASTSTLVSIAVAPGELSAPVIITPQTTPVSVTLASSAMAIAGLPFTPSPGDAAVVTLYQTQLGVPRLVHSGRFGVTPTGGATITYANYAPSHPNVDVYILSAGQTLQGSAPTFTNVQLGATSLPVSAPTGVYRLIVTPAGKQTILFQSGTLTSTGNGPVFMLGAPRSGDALQPYPLQVSRAAAARLEDDRPLVRVLRSESAAYAQHEILHIDCDPVARVPYQASSGPVYHVTPSTRSLSNGCGASLPPGTAEAPFVVSAGANLIQRFGATRYSNSSGQILSYGFLAPEANADFPIPAGKARVRFKVNNPFRATDVYIGGALREAAVMSKEFLLDVNPGTVDLALMLPATNLSEGTQRLTVAAGHYYLVEAGHFGSPMTVGILQLTLYQSGAPVERSFEVNRDD